jgi:hypothetical protein
MGLKWSFHMAVTPLVLKTDGMAILGKKQVMVSNREVPKKGQRRKR